jgi:hypothetical protein
MTDRRERDKLKAEQDAKINDKANEGVAKVQDAYRTGGETAARSAANAHYIDLHPDFNVKAPATPDAPMEPSTPTGGMRGFLPSGGTIELDLAQEEGARKQAGARAAETWLPTMKDAIASSPFGPKAAQLVVGEMQTGMLKEDPNAAFTKRLQDLENQANWEKRTRIGRVGAGGTGHAGSAATLIDMIENGKDGQPYPTAELARAATELGVPLNGKAGSTNLDALLKTTTFRQKGADIHHRSTERDAGLVITDPDTGEDLGQVKNSIEAKSINKTNAAFTQLRNRTQALIDDIESNGDRVLSPSAIQRRESRMAAVAAAGRVYNGLGATDASQKLEQEIVGHAGTPGHGFMMGANVDVVKNVLAEAEKSHRERLRIALRNGAAGVPAPEGSVTPEDAQGDLDWLASQRKR